MTISLVWWTMMTRILLLANLWFGCVVSFTSQQQHGRVGNRGIVELSMAGESDFLSKLSNPFVAREGGYANNDASSSSQQLLLGSQSESFDSPGAEILVGKAKAVIATDLGIQDPSLLDENFLWIGPLLEKPLGKVDYLAAGRFFSLRTAFPDLDYRPHDFRIDENNPLTVRCTVRPLGVMRGPLRLRTELVQPNGKQWRGPPEAISLTFDPDTGKVVKLCSGFAMDRFVGNTNGLCGVMAAATVAGVPPSDWEVYPIPAVISRFFGRPVDPVGEVSTFLAPFPETVMIQLVKGILTTTLAADDASLLSKDFSFVTPSVGPVGKSKFLESYAAQEFGGFEPEFSHFRVDPFDPYRVWVDVKPVGPGLEGPPQAYSFTFDDDGFCTRMTAGAVMDPSIGNTGGLTGAAGIKYAIGEGDFDLTVRPFPVAVGRFKKAILSPLTKIATDDYVLDPSRRANTTDEETPELDPVEARKVLAEARARIQEEEAKKKQFAMEEEVRLRALQEAEQEKIRLRQEAEDELRKAREDMEQEILRREAEFRKSIESTMSEEKSESPIPVPLKMALPKITPPKIPAPPTIKPPSFGKVATPQKFTKSSPPPTKITADKKRADLEEKRAAAEEIRKRNDAETSAALAKKQKEMEGKRVEAEKSRKEVAARKKADLEQRKAAADEARKRKAAETNAAIAKTQKKEEEKRLLAQKKQKEAISKGMDAINGAFSAFQSQPYPMVSKAVTERKQSLSATRQRPSLQISKPPSKSGPKTPPSPPRPSFQIPSFGRGEAKPKPKSPASKPRPSFQLPQFRKPDSKPEAQPKPKSPASKPRPSFQLPQFGKPDAKPEAQSKPKSPASKPRPSFQIPQFGKAMEQPSATPSKPRPSLQIPQLSIPKNSQSARPFATVPSATKAPNGIPTIVAWRKVSNGGVSGQIFGSINFKEGERVETSTIVSGEFENGSVVTTESRSKYFLSGESVLDMRAANAKSAPKPSTATASKPRATLQLSKKAKDNDAKAAQAALEAASQATSASQEKRPTFSLSALFGMDQPSDSPPNPQSKKSIPSPKVSRSPALKQAPKGVPSIARWKQNRDKSITGFVSGSPSFSEGERVTTSPIARGVITSGEIVVTSSGTRYFLQ